MKNLRVIYILLFSIFILSCSSDDDNTDDAPSKGPAAQATINGDSFNNYIFKLGVYQVTKDADDKKITIELVDKEGKMFTLFLNNTGGFSSGTVKEMGDVDSNKFKTYVLIRNSGSSYYSDSGNVKITNHREDPSDSKQRLISGEFNIKASTIADKDKESRKIEMKGSFKDLAYKN